MRWVLLTGVMVAVAGANLLMKAAAMRANAQAAADVAATGSLWRSVRDPRVAAALGLLGGGFVLWAWALRKFDVSIAYPAVTGGGLILVTVAAAWWLGESVTPWRATGIALIILGCFLLTR